MNKIFEKEFEAQAEYVLSDYMGDVKKVLSTKATVIPTSRFVNAGEAQFVGSVEFDILYSDVEGKLTSVQTNADYDFSLPIDEGAKDAFLESRVSNYSVRLTGPRKFVLRAALSSEVYVNESDTIVCLGDVFEDSREPETVTKTVKIENAIYTTSSEREYAEEGANLEGVSADSLDVIATSGAVRILEVDSEDGGVRVKGEIILTSIIRRDEEPPFAIKKIIPFEELVTLEGATSDMQSSARGYLTSAVTSLVESEDSTAVNLNTIMELSVISAYNEELTVTTDAYLESYDTVAEYEDFSYSLLLLTESVNENINCEILRGGTGYENIRDVLCGSFDVRSLSKEMKDNGFALSGEIVLNGVACEINEDNSVSYMPIKYTTPFDINVNTKLQMPADARVECKAYPIDVDFVIDADKISAKCSLSISYRVYKDSSVKRIKSCNTEGEEYEKVSSSIIRVYYPKNTDTLFDVARRYHTTSRKIAADNCLTEECLSSSDKESSLSGVKRIIIK